MPQFPHLRTCGHMREPPVGCYANASAHSRKQQQLCQLGVGTRNGHLTVSAAHPLLPLPWVPHREQWGTEPSPFALVLGWEAS